MSERYQIKAKIGEGGVGAVWVAFDRELNRDVAIKRLKPSGSAVPEAVQAQADDLIREAQTLSALQHPNIVTVYDAGRDDKGAFVVMELLRGKTLDAEIGSGTLSIEDFDQLAKQCLDGMAAAQARGLVHRDLKPGNIMVNRLPSGGLQCKILDFGLAKFSREASRQTEDQEGGIYGSVHFMAPEQFERQPLDARTDMYALGCIFYYALAGRYPFEGETSAEVMASHLQHRAEHLKTLRDGIPPWLADWVMWLINRKPEHRPESAHAALERFQLFSGVVAAANVPSPPTPSPPAAAPAASGEPVAVSAAATAPPPVPPPPAGIPAPPVSEAFLPPSPSPPPPPEPASKRRMQRRTSPAGILVVLMLSAVLIGTAIWGYTLYDSRRTEKSEIELFNRLTVDEVDNPKGDATAVEIIAKIMQREGGNTAEHGAECLEKLKGPGVEQAIVRQIGMTTSDTQVKFINVAVKRRLKDTVSALVKAATSREERVREAALTGLAELAQPEDLDALFGLIDENIDTQRNRQLLTEAIYGASSRAQGSKGSVRLISALKQIKGGQQRGLLLKVLGRLGGDEALSTLEAELQNSDKEAQRTAVLGLTSWPNGKAAPVLSAFADRIEDPSLRSLAMMGFVQVIGRSGDMPGEKKVLQLVEAAKNASGSREKKALFQQLAKIPDEAALNFLEELYLAAEEANDVETTRYAEQAERQLSDLLPRVIDITDVEVLLDAESALIAGQGPFFNRIENTVQNWNNPAAWVLWHVRIAEPGSYLLEVIQAHEGETTNTYGVAFGGSVLQCEVVTTPTREQFENIEAGVVEITEPGLYEIIIKPKKLEGGSLMTLRGIALVKET